MRQGRMSIARGRARAKQRLSSESIDVSSLETASTSARPCPSASSANLSSRSTCRITRSWSVRARVSNEYGS